MVAKFLELWPQGLEAPKPQQNMETMGVTDVVHDFCYQLHGKHWFY